MAGVAALVIWWFPHIENGFFKVAGWSAIALPCATVVMCVDQFLLPRVLGLRRPVERIPEWRAAGLANWPACCTCCWLRWWRAPNARAILGFPSHLRRGESEAPVAPAPAPGTTG